MVSKLRLGRARDRTEVPLSGLNEEYVKCEYCSRTFAPVPAARHIPLCKDTKNRPRPPPTHSAVILPNLGSDEGRGRSQLEQRLVPFPQNFAAKAQFVKKKELRSLTRLKLTRLKCENCNAWLPQEACFCMMCGFKRTFN